MTTTSARIVTRVSCRGGCGRARGPHGIMRVMISVADAQAHILAQVTRSRRRRWPRWAPASAACSPRTCAPPSTCRPPTTPPWTATRSLARISPRRAAAPRRWWPSSPRARSSPARSGPGQALRIMTGAPMPAGADTVYPQEIVERRGRSRAASARCAPASNVRHRGEDVRAGAVVLAAGTRAPAAGAGRRRLARPAAAPRAPAAARGDPLHRRRGGRAGRPAQARPDLRLEPLLAARPGPRRGRAATDHGIVPDLYDVLHARLRDAAATADVVITSGGVSVGDHDLVKAVLQERGRDRFLAGGDATRPAARGRADRVARTSSGCPAIRWPRC